MTLSQLKQKIGIKIEDLNEETLLYILKNPEYKNFFNDRRLFLGLLDEILERNQDKNFLKEIYTIKYSLELLQNEEIISNLFTSYRNESITREKLLETMKNYRNSEDSIFVISVFICSLIALPDVDLSLEIEKLEKNIEKVKSIFENLGELKGSYNLRCDLIDLICQIRTKIFSVYNHSIDISWLDKEIDKIDEFTLEILNKRELPEINIKPEQLGFIDITKLKKE